MEKTKMGITSMILGIIGLVLSWIPVLNNVSFILGILGLVFSIVGFVAIKNGKKDGKGFCITGLITSILSVIIVFATQSFYGTVLDETSKTLEEESQTSYSEYMETEVEENNAKYTEEQFKQIDVGMTYEEVVNILGSEGTLDSEYTYSDYKVQSFSWGDYINGGMNITFENGVVKSKYQYSL